MEYAHLIEEPANWNIVVVKNKTAATPLNCCSVQRDNVINNDFLFAFTVKIFFQAFQVRPSLGFVPLTDSKIFSKSSSLPSMRRTFFASVSLPMKRSFVGVMILSLL